MKPIFILLIAISLYAENIKCLNAIDEEYVQFARLHIDTYRCSCGSLGRIGYQCSNKECNKY